MRWSFQAAESGMRIHCPTAVHFDQQADAAEGGSSAKAIVSMGEAAHFVWAPRSRETAF